MNVYRGDIFFVTGSGGRINGSEQKQDRPAVVVSNDKANEHSPVIEVVFLTSAEKSRYLPTHVDVMCQIPSVALCEQVNSISKSRLGAYVRTCTGKEMAMIDAALMISLGLNPDVTCNEADDSQIDDLKMKLEGAERALDEAKEKFTHEKNVCHALQVELDEARKQICELNQEVIKYQNDGLILYDGICKELEAERDKYKRWFESLFEKSIAG